MTHETFQELKKNQKVCSKEKKLSLLNYLKILV